MKIVSYALCFIGAFLNLFVLVKCYEKTVNYRNYSFIKFIVYLIIGTVINFLVNIYLPVWTKVLCFIISLIFIFKLIFKEDLKIVIIKSLILYILLMLVDFVSSIVISTFLSSKVNVLNENTINLIKGFCTLIVSFFYMLIFSIRNFAKLVNKVVNFFVNYQFIISCVLLESLFLILLILSSFFSFKASLKLYLLTLLISLVICFLFSLLVYLTYKNKTALAEQKALLNIMNEYESMLEVNRENRHEMLNNLVVLKSFKNKASIEYEDLLSEILNDYQNKKNGAYTRLYTLPTGVKGIVYYKVANIIDKNINFNTEISKEVYTYFDKLDAKLYYKVCKIIGILLDNAIEATIHTNEKLIFIEMFKLGNELFVLIQNSCEDKVDIENINKKGFSTKGKNHGYGLYIVNKLITSSEQLSLSQYMFDKDFVTELKITL